MSCSYIGVVVSACTIAFFAVIILNYQLEVLPIHGYLLVFYIFTLSVISAWTTFISLQSFLKRTKPVAVKFEQVNFVSLLNILIKQNPSSGDNPQKFELELRSLKIRAEDTRNGLPREISGHIGEFVEDVESRFILKWYKYISSDPNFSSETKKILEEIVKRFLQVVVEVDNKKLSYGISVLILNHIKEFRKAIKRAERNAGAVEDMYRYSHVGNKSQEAMENYVHRLTTDILKQFINWELYCSLPCKILVSILARKLVMYMLNNLSSPSFLNHKVLLLCSPNNKYREYDLTEFTGVKVTDVNLNMNVKSKNKTVEVIEEKVSKSQENENCTNLNTNLDSKNYVDETDCAMEQKWSVKSNTQCDNIISLEKVLSDSTGGSNLFQLKTSEPVKIYKSKSANNTWRNSSDLQCISLGEDSLELQNETSCDTDLQIVIEPNLWKEKTEHTKRDEPADIVWISQEPSTMANFTSNCSKAVTNTTSLISNTIKPIGNVTAQTLNNMKEFQQNTVNTVDEAAGVVEGILDFGMAGLRKGLRLTGLPENFSELASKSKHEQKTELLRHEAVEASTFNTLAHKLTKVPHIKSIEEKYKPIYNSNESEESVWINPLRESPNYDGNILLEKTPDKNEKTLGSTRPEIPQIAEDVLLANDSPEPEYEETADFATTIAKLRTLLQQKSSESGVNTPSLSPMLHEDLQKSSDGNHVDVTAEQEDLSKVDGTMPSLYKFCARTATGVFQNTLNTIKTALPGNVNESTQFTLQNRGNWTYVEACSFSNDFQSRMEKLISERKAFCTIDTAYEAINSLDVDVADQSEFAWTSYAIELEDELDEFAFQIPITKTLVDILCELMSDSNVCFTQEAAVKIFLLLFGKTCENFVNTKTEKLLHNIKNFVGKLPESLNDSDIKLELNEMIQFCMDHIPDYFVKTFGSSAVKSAIKLLMISFQSHKINQHLLIQIFELCASEVILAKNKFTPAYSA